MKPCLGNLPDIENCSDGRYVDGQLYVPPVLYILGNNRKQYNTCSTVVINKPLINLLL